MDQSIEINDLLTRARKLRRCAEETAMPLYRAKFIGLARDVEGRATEMDLMAGG